LLVYTLSKRAP